MRRADKVNAKSTTLAFTGKERIGYPLHSCCWNIGSNLLPRGSPPEEEAAIARTHNDLPIRTEGDQTISRKKRVTTPPRAWGHPPPPPPRATASIGRARIDVLREKYRQKLGAPLRVGINAPNSSASCALIRSQSPTASSKTSDCLSVVLLLQSIQHVRALASDSLGSTGDFLRSGRFFRAKRRNFSNAVRMVNCRIT